MYACLHVNNCAHVHTRARAQGRGGGNLVFGTECVPVLLSFPLSDRIQGVLAHVGCSAHDLVQDQGHLLLVKSRQLTDLQHTCRQPFAIQSSQSTLTGPDHGTEASVRERRLKTADMPKWLFMTAVNALHHVCSRRAGNPRPKTGSFPPQRFAASLCLHIYLPICLPAALL